MGRALAAGVTSALLIGGVYLHGEGYIGISEEGKFVVNTDPSSESPSTTELGLPAGPDTTIPPRVPAAPVETTAPAPPCTNLGEVPVAIKAGQLVMPLVNTANIAGDGERIASSGAGNFGVVGSFSAANEVSGRSAGDTVALGEQINGLKSQIHEATGFPASVAIDEEGGSVQRTIGLDGAADLPSAREQSEGMALTDITSTFTAHSQWLVDKLGITVNFAPVADVGDGQQVGDRSYGSDVETVARNANAAMQGMIQGGIAPTVKHWPGLGHVDTDTHSDQAATPPWSQLRQNEVPAFTSLFEAGAPNVMVSHAVVPELTRGLPASISPEAYDALRNTDFAGVAFTDDLSMQGVTGSISEPSSYGVQATAAVRALTAGADVALINMSGSSSGEDILGRTQAAIIAEIEAGRYNPDPSVRRVLEGKGIDVCD